MRKIRKIIVHHTGDTDTRPQFAKVNEWHRHRGFPLSALGYYCGYHIFIERDGTMKFPRLFSEIGAHDFQENEDSLGVGLAGNFSQEKPTPMQTLMLSILLKILVPAFNIDPEDIEPHRIHDTTDCYGNLLADDWARNLLST